MYEAPEHSSILGVYTLMLRLRVPGLPGIVKRLAVVGVQMSKRSKDPAGTTPEPAAKRQRIFTSAAGASEDVKVQIRFNHSASASALAYASAEGCDLLQMAQAAQLEKTIIPHEQFAALRQNMEHSDAQREIIIKKSRGAHSACPSGNACPSSGQPGKSSNAIMCRPSMHQPRPARRGLL